MAEARRGERRLSFLWRSVPDEAVLAALPETERFGPERSAKQAFDRLVGTWTYWAWKGGYFGGSAPVRPVAKRTISKVTLSSGGSE